MEGQNLVKIEPLTPTLEPAWDNFVLAHPRGWFWHTAAWLDYGVALGSGRENASFAVLDASGAVVGVCPLIREGLPPEPGAYLFEGEPGAWPLAVDARALDAMAGELARRGIPARFRSCPLVDVSLPPAFWRESKALWRSRVVNLRPEYKELHAAVRRSYKALINAGQKNSFVGGANAGPEYEQVHRAALGSRPDRTYALQSEWLRRSWAFVVGAAAEYQWQAFAYVVVYKRRAYYASGPSLRRDLMHAVVWRAICEAKSRGCEAFELGWQGHAQAEKERHVELFKAGFGGTNVPVWVAEVGL